MAQYERLDTDAPGLEFRSFLGDEGQQQGAATQTAPSRGWADQSRGGPAPVWSIDYYQKWFDVDTVTVLARIIHSFNPFAADPSPFTGPPASEPSFAFIPSTTDAKPDLYGPFCYLSAEPFDYDFALLSVGASLVYAYGIGTPFAVWGALRYLGTEWSIVEGIAVWGYAMAIWIPVAALCIIPIPILRWVLVGLAFGSSGWYITRNVYPVLASADQKPARLIIVVLAVLHAAIALTFKVLFFSYYIVPQIGGKDPIGGSEPVKNTTRIFP
ncbi:unnamed protein product [Rhizoctonia solani]|nr:unnamed protein product [Rhizoctonia solani]